MRWTLKGYCRACLCHGCQKCRCSLSTTRQLAIQLFCASLLVTFATILYISSFSGLSDKVVSRTYTTLTPSTVFSQTPTNSSFSLINRTLQNVDRFVSFNRETGDGRGLGNQMFNLVAVIYVAQLTGRQPDMPVFDPKLAMEAVFELEGIARYTDEICPCYEFREQSERHLMYDSRVEEFAKGGLLAQKARAKSIHLAGYWQSWKYTRNIERRLRLQQFTLLPQLRQFVDEFLAESRPADWQDAGYVRVGVHVRRGDVLNPNKIDYGYTTPDVNYFAHAMRYFVERFERIQFIVASNDISWCRRNFPAHFSKSHHRVNVTFLRGQSLEKDFAILASCEHSIMSTGTYGWWAAWLARGITIYYADWPRNGSELARKFRREDFFLPNWIGMT